MKTINLGSVQLPSEAVTKTFAILAKKGAGKSYTAGVMEEEFFLTGIPFVVFDPIDVHWGLRYEAKDTSHPGFPVVVFGVLDNADVQLTEDMGAEIAEAVVKQNVSCIISTFGMSKKGQRKLITEFSETLLRINNTPRHIFIEEAHEFVPQRITSDLGRCFSAVEALVVMGRNRGLGVTLINQRASTINKDVLTQIDTLLVFRTIAPQDRKALEDWIAIHGVEDDKQKFMESLASLPTGEGWLWSPEWLEKFERIKIRERITLHPDRESIAAPMMLQKNGEVQKFIDSFKARLLPISKKDAKIDLTGSKDWGQKKESKDADIKQVSESFRQIIVEKDEYIEKLIKENERLIKNIELAKQALSGKLDTQVPKDLGTSNSSVYGMWLSKIGENTSAGRILKLLKEKDGVRFTKAQIRTMVGISSKSSGMGSAISLLKRNDLVREENGYILINPNIL